MLSTGQSRCLSHASASDWARRYIGTCNWLRVITRFQIVTSRVTVLRTNFVYQFACRDWTLHHPAAGRLIWHGLDACGQHHTGRKSFDVQKWFHVTSMQQVEQLILSLSLFHFSFSAYHRLFLCSYNVEEAKKSSAPVWSTRVGEAGTFLTFDYLLSRGLKRFELDSYLYFFSWETSKREKERKANNVRPSTLPLVLCSVAHRKWNEEKTGLLTDVQVVLEIAVD